MKLEKKHYIIIGVAIALIAVWYFFLRKKKTTTSSYVARVAPFGSGKVAPLVSNYSGNEFPGLESGFAKKVAPIGKIAPIVSGRVAGTSTPTDVKHPTCNRSCPKCFPSNAPCIGAGGYLVD